MSNPLEDIDWGVPLATEFDKPYWRRLQTFLDRERSLTRVYPESSDVFSAFTLTPLQDTRVVILGQDPYHGQGQAHGLCFSVRHGPIPSSLRSIFAELHDDLDIPVPGNGNLEPWSCRGVLLLNSTLTVSEGAPGSHYGQGWEIFTDEVIRVVNRQDRRVVFLLWGNPARAKRGLIRTPLHAVIESAHPVAPAGRPPFRGSKPFSRANAALAAAGRSVVNWRL